MIAKDFIITKTFRSLALISYILLKVFAIMSVRRSA